METALFISLAAAVIIATVISLLMKALKQPLILGYIITGILVGPYVLGIVPSDGALTILSKIGITLLLFVVGIGLDPKSIKEVGKVAALSGLGQIALTASAGFLICHSLGFSSTESAFMAVALTLSSTIIVMKLLSDKNEIETLHGKISMGILLMQDLFALFLLLAVSPTAAGSDILTQIIKAVASGAVLVALVAVIAVFALPRIMSYVASSQELLFLFSIGWVFLIASLFNLANFSIEMGALLAGIALSMSPYKYEMSAKVRPLRDFFILLFFIVLGSQLSITDVGAHIGAIIVLSLFVLIGNPMIVMAILCPLGYTMRTAFLTGITMAQVSEFSFILMGLAATAGYVRPEIGSIVTTVGLVTIAVSSIMIPHSARMYQGLSPLLKWIEGIFGKEDAKVDEHALGAEVILFGHNRIGHDLLNSLKKIKKDVLVIDYDPDVIRMMESQGIKCRYGDANDHELLDEIDLKKAKMVISTIPSEETNHLLIDSLRKRNKKAIFIGVSHQIDEALRLYDSGASYVLLPHFLGGTFAADMIARHGLAPHKFKAEKRGHIKNLKLRKKLGHEHPRIAKH